MAFQTKTFLAITASCVNRMRSITQRITDYTVGSVARTLIEAPAQEIDELYQQMQYGLLDAIQTAVYTSFNFPALPATPATGLIRISIAVQPTDTLIATGTTINRADGSMSYSATADITIPAGSSFADVPVAANIAGIAGNMAALGSFTTSLAIPGFVSAINLAAFINGSDVESISAQKVRFNAYIQALSRGTIPALMYALTRLTFLTDSLGNITESVATANINEPYLSDPAQTPGLVLAYVHNGVGGTSPGLVSQAANVLNGYVTPLGVKVAGYKAAGVVVNVFAASETVVSVTGMILVAPGFDKPTVALAVTAALFAYIASIPVGSPYLAAVASEQVMQVDGVTDWIPVSPVSYVSAGINNKLMPGTFLVVGWLAASTSMTSRAWGALA
jgi:uncharacterized phage protein gp47/JayE